MQKCLTLLQIKNQQCTGTDYRDPTQAASVGDAIKFAASGRISSTKTHIVAFEEPCCMPHLVERTMHELASPIIDASAVLQQCE